MERRDSELTLIKSEKGSRGVWRRYQHARLGFVETTTMFAKGGGGVVIHLRVPSQRTKHVVGPRRGAHAIV